MVLVAAGDEVPVPGRGDRSYPLRAHSEYLSLADRERPGGVLAYAPADRRVEFALLARARGRDDVNWKRVDELHWFGGVRLEQNVLITDDGCEILTAVAPP